MTRGCDRNVTYPFLQKKDVQESFKNLTKFQSDGRAMAESRVSVSGDLQVRLRDLDRGTLVLGKV